MANEIIYEHSETGVTLYVRLADAAGDWWDAGGALDFETPLTSAWTDYGIAMTEPVAGSYQFVATFPSHANVPAGTYTLVIFKRLTGVRLITDTRLAISPPFRWNGAAEIDGALIDTIAFDKAMTAILAKLLGKATVTGAAVSFKKRDGAAEAANVTHDAYGNRTASTIP